uniref:two-partner secretion domain-containing protein n=1 Tax=Selenomonas ruminantium TaxID=971 RepID=UPI0026EE474E
MKRNERLSRKARYGILATIMAGAFSIMPAAQAMPTGGASETATITTTGSTMDIASSVTNNLLTWQDFSIAKGETVNFGGSNTYLNVVTGNNASEIYGAITGSAANVYLINPNGILFGDGAQVNVGSLHLSTADIANNLTDFNTALGALNGTDSFSGDIVNKGTLKAAQEITVDGNNITFKNTENVSAASVTLTATGSGEIHIGSQEGKESGYTVNKGTEIDYKLIHNAEELQNIKDGLTGNYMLASDIDASQVEKFIPIGMIHDEAGYSTSAFSGRFDGLGYTISGLQIDVRHLNGESAAGGSQVVYEGQFSRVGLFGSIGEDAVVENVGLQDGSVKVTFGDSSQITNPYTIYAGSLAGSSSGTIRNVYSTTPVTMQMPDNVMIGYPDGDITGYVGGLVGQNTGTISKAYTTGEVKGSLSGRGCFTDDAIALYVGGLAGINTNSGKIMQAYHGTGAVSASQHATTYWVKAYTERSGTYVGGLVGSNAGELTDTYNTGVVSGSIQAEKFKIEMTDGSLHAGGIVGTQASQGTLSRSYNTGAVSASLNAKTSIAMNSVLAGGIAGQTAGKITSAYNIGVVTTTANADTVRLSKKNNGDIIGEGNIDLLDNTGKLTAEQATAAASFNGFNLTKDGKDKDAVWRIYEGQTMPLLTAFMQRKDDIRPSKEYDGGKPAGTNKTAATLTSTQEEGINWVDEVNIITPKNVTITFQNADKTYDGTTEVKTVNANLDGVLDSDKENVALSATGTYDSKNAGDRTVTYSGIALTGTGAANYQLTGLTEGKGTGNGTITAAPLTITFADTNKQYDGTTNAVAGQGTLKGVLG